MYQLAGDPTAPHRLGMKLPSFCPLCAPNEWLEEKDYGWALREQEPQIGSGLAGADGSLGRCFTYRLKLHPAAVKGEEHRMVAVVHLLAVMAKDVASRCKECCGLQEHSAACEVVAKLQVLGMLLFPSCLPLSSLSSAALDACTGWQSLMPTIMSTCGSSAASDSSVWAITTAGNALSTKQPETAARLWHQRQK